MPVVTLLERQKRNKERVNVYLDGEFAFGLHELDAARLRKGQHLSESEVAELKSQDAIQQATEYGVKLLSYRPRSAHEIRQKLLQRPTDPAVIEAAMERLTRLGYVDDHAFGRFWIENRTAFKPLGARALRYELRQKGLDQAVIDGLVQEIVDEDDAAYQAARKRLATYRRSTPQQFIQKMGAFLQRRGFGYGTSRQAIQRLIDEIAEEDPQFFTPDVD